MKYLYKYRSLSRMGRAHTESIIVDREVYFAKPQEFNDPFDCLPAFEFKATKEELKDFLYRALERNDSPMNELQRFEFVETAVKKDQDGRISEESRDIFRTSYFNALKSTGILSLSKKCDHTLMWSHYADSHKGVCLRFNVGSKSPFFEEARKVDYQNERPILNLVKDDTQLQIQRALFTKADYWEYEQEHRLLSVSKTPGVEKYPAELLDGVVLGAQTSPEDRALVLEWISRVSHKVEVLQASICSNKFRLSIDGAAG